MRRVDFFAYNSLSRCSPPASLPLLSEAAELTFARIVNRRRDDRPPAPGGRACIHNQQRRRHRPSPYGRLRSSERLAFGRCLLKKVFLRINLPASFPSTILLAPKCSPSPELSGWAQTCHGCARRFRYCSGALLVSFFSLRLMRFDFQTRESMAAGLPASRFWNCSSSSESWGFCWR